MSKEIKELAEKLKQCGYPNAEADPEVIASRVINLGYRKQSDTIKEFAEKVKALIDERKYKAGFSANMLWADTAQGCVDELAKEYGVEVEE